MKVLAAVMIVMVVFGTCLLAGGKGSADAGKTAFLANCKMCHGPQGEGNPAIAKVLKTNIPVLGSKEVQAKSDDEIRKIIGEGAGKMKPVPAVSGKAVDDVIAFVRTLAK